MPCFTSLQTFLCSQVNKLTSFSAKTSLIQQIQQNMDPYPQNGPPRGMPVPAHDMTQNGSLQRAGTPTKMYGANPPPAWSHRKYPVSFSDIDIDANPCCSICADVGPEYKAPPPVATQLVVPTELSDGPVTLTCFHCQEHMTTRTKTGPSFLSWALCACLCIFA